ncbi:MAG: phosphopentomutase [Trueperaceae bacterium]|nr:phosphopentomutase [Trueperaceae bacterium]
MTVTVIVLDSVGLGALPDAEAFGDVGAHTLDHALEVSRVNLPHFTDLGLGNIPGVTSLANVEKPLAAYGKMLEVSPGKDTTTGHWEFMGVVLEHAFKTFPPDYPSFPKVVMDAFDKVTAGHLGNYAASGTEIIEELGVKHLETRKPIVYTSADSVFQIACHTDVVSLEQLYDWCKAARGILQGEYSVARVIARPFQGQPGAFERIGTARKDFSVSPPHTTVLDRLKEAGKEVIGVGKIPDIYNHQGFTQEVKTSSNLDGLEKTLELMKQQPDGFIFTNLVEFDSLYGHRRNPEGYARALKDVDERIPDLLNAVGEQGLLIFTSDHGNDPTWKGTDHTREYGMLLVYGPQLKAHHLGIRESFADIGATVAKVLDVSWSGAGSSFI